MVPARDGRGAVLHAPPSPTTHQDPSNRSIHTRTSAAKARARVDANATTEKMRMVVGLELVGWLVGCVGVGVWGKRRDDRPVCVPEAKAQPQNHRGLRLGARRHLGQRRRVCKDAWALIFDRGAATNWLGRRFCFVLFQSRGAPGSPQLLANEHSTAAQHAEALSHCPFISTRSDLAGHRPATAKKPSPKP